MPSKKPIAKAPKPLSEGEETLAMHLASYGIQLAREYAFEPGRKWRWDFADVERKIAIEVDGGTWNGGRHSHGRGYENDARKLNTAALRGWVVYRFTTGMVKSGEAIEWIRSALTL